MAVLFELSFFVLVLWYYLSGFILEKGQPSMVTITWEQGEETTVCQSNKSFKNKIPTLVFE